MDNKILLSHGSGGSKTHDLIKQLFVKYFNNDYLNQLADSALLDLPSEKICFTTDSYVVKPLSFPGGDIGKLAICGTVNDLAVCGAKPLYISCGFIIEEGFDIGELEGYVKSMAETAKSCGVRIVTGDTKVVERGAADGLYINTSGIGTRYEGLDLGYDKIEASDKIIISGNIGDHGMAVMCARNELKIQSDIKSDCAPLNELIDEIIKRGTSHETRGTIRFMRDPTRGGVATTLCEIAEGSGLNIEIEEDALPISEDVNAISEILGIDPLYSANEGKVIVIVAEKFAKDVIGIMSRNPISRNAKIIGQVTSTKKGEVLLNTKFGTARRLTMLTGAQLPRIC